MKKWFSLLVAAVLAVSVLPGTALAMTPAPPEPPDPPEPPYAVGEPLVAYNLEYVDGLAEDAGYRIVEGVRGGIVRKYVKVSSDWMVTYVVLTDGFAFRSVFDLTSDEAGAIMGYPASVVDGMVSSVKDFVGEWFMPVELEPPEAVPVPSPVPDP